MLNGARSIAIVIEENSSSKCEHREESHGKGRRRIRGGINSGSRTREAGAGSRHAVAGLGPARREWGRTKPYLAKMKTRWRR